MAVPLVSAVGAESYLHWEARLKFSTMFSQLAAPHSFLILVPVGMLKDGFDFRMGRMCGRQEHDCVLAGRYAAYWAGSAVRRSSKVLTKQMQTKLAELGRRSAAA